MKLTSIFKIATLSTLFGMYAASGWAVENTPVKDVDAQSVFINRSTPLYLQHSTDKKQLFPTLAPQCQGLIHISSDGADYVGTRKRAS